jgi:hypothetical protein
MLEHLLLMLKWPRLSGNYGLNTDDDSGLQPSGHF